MRYNINPPPVRCTVDVDNFSVCVVEGDVFVNYSTLADRLTDLEIMRRKCLSTVVPVRMEHFIQKLLDLRNV